MLLIREKVATKRKRLIKMIMSSRYKDLNKREYDIFIKVCDNIFDTQSTIYKLKLSKTQFVQSLLNDDSANQ